MRMIKRNFLSVAVSAGLLWGCQSVDTTQPGTVGVDRDQRMMVSAEEVDAGAKKAYAQMMGEAQKKGALDRDPAQVQRVKTIVSRLVPQTGVFRPDALKWQWEAHVVSIDEANAWCMPGGKMAVYTGLIQKLQLTDDELAAVMGHEIAHALREHSREQMSRQMATQMGIGIAGALFGVGELGQGLGNMVADVTLNLPKSRVHEIEADRIGVELAARAGYDPHAAIRLWEKMAKSAGGGQPPKWLSTHPSHEDRLKDLQVYAEKVKPLYAAAKGSPSAGK
jgi:predicted Zn-dependent protease